MIHLCMIEFIELIVCCVTKAYKQLQNGEVV